MAGGPAEDAAARRDALVQQLLEERRRRLQSKLCQDSGTWLLSDETPGGRSAPESDPPRSSSPRRRLPTSACSTASAYRTPGTSQPEPRYIEDAWASPPTPRSLARSSHSATPPSPSPRRRWEDFGVEPPASFAEPVTERAGYGQATASSSGVATALQKARAAREAREASAEPSYSTPRGARRPSAAWEVPADAPEAGVRVTASYASDGGASARSARPRSAPPRQHWGNRLQAWTLRYEAFQHRQQQARQDKENQEMKECTFRPAINNKSEFYARRTRGCFIEPLAERLHHEADKREALRSKAKELMEADTMCSYTFHPQINQQPPSKQAGRAPIHERVPIIQRRKQEKVRQVQTAEERRAECSFQPRISGRSEKLVQKKRDRLYRSLSQGDASCLKMLGPVEERLYAEAQASEQRRAAKQDMGSEASQITPSMDDASRRICRNSVYFRGAQQDFLTRQQTFELAKQRRMEVRAQHADAACSFHPKISDTSRQLVSGNVELVGETIEDRVMRLAVKDVERRDQLREQLEQQQYRECTFHPEVNSNSPQAPAVPRADDATSSDSGADCGGSVHERLYRSSVGRSRLSEDSHVEEHSFKPQMDPKSAKRFAHVKPRYGSTGSQLMENIREELERKQELLLERRRELEEHELEGCTFAPETHKSYEEPPRPVVVSGLGRFFELKSLAQKRQQELREREAKVFRPEQNTTRYGGVTIPEPFELSTGHREECPAAKKVQELSRQLDECTFLPQAEADGREAIRQLMSSPLVC